MESIEQPIFNPYGSDDKDELIDDPSPRGATHLPAENTNSNNDTSPVQAAKGLLSSGKESLSQQNKGLVIIIAGVVVFAIIITIALILTIYLVPKQIGGHAAVVTEVGTCSDIGLDVIRRGGNAVDGAVAAAFCLGVVHPQSSGIGGGGFLLYHDHKNHKSVAYDFRETAPAKATTNMLTGISDVDISGLAVGVPGELKGLAEVHSEWGSMDWATLIQPSVDLARYGFNVTKNLADSLANHVDISRLVPPSEFLNQFMNDGEFVKEGEVLVWEQLAKTLEEVQEGGADVFYRGVMGESFVTTIKEAGGVMEMSDLEGYTVHRKEPVQSSFKGNTVVGMPAPSSGPVVALMLNMLEGFNWTQASIGLPETYHQMIETFKFGFGHRSLLGDPANEKYKQDIENATAQLLSAEFAAGLRAKIDNVSHSASFYGPTVAPTLNKGTTHISVIDSNEVMVSLTLTNNYWFGTKLMTEDGILANNEMLDFSIPTSALPPNERNMIMPGMRPLSSMTPTIVYNTEHPCAKRVVMGASNGTRIITGVVETLVNAFIFDQSLREAVARPRLHNQLYPPDTEYEDVISPSGRYAFPDDIIQTLRQKGQTMVKATEGLSCVQAIMKINDDVQVNSDWRKGGRPAMF